MCDIFSKEKQGEKVCTIDWKILTLLGVELRPSDESLCNTCVDICIGQNVIWNFVSARFLETRKSSLRKVGRTKVFNDIMQNFISVIGDEEFPSNSTFMYCPVLCDIFRSLSSLITNSTLLCLLFKIKDWCKKCTIKVWASYFWRKPGTY